MKWYSECWYVSELEKGEKSKTGIEKWGTEKGNYFEGL